MKEKDVLYSLNDKVNFEFIKLPKIILNDSKLCIEAKIIYSLILDRLCLSNINGLADNKGTLYIYYTRENLADQLNISVPTVVKAIKQLEENGLILQKRLGQGRPNRIYIYKLDEKVQSLKKFNSRNKDFLSLDIKNFKLKQTKSTNTQVLRHRRYINSNSINYEDYYDNI